MNAMRLSVLLAVSVCLLQGSGMRAVADDFPLAMQQAQQKILDYRLARNSGDAKSIREATMRLQEDPLAIRHVNNTASEDFKMELNKDIGTVQQQTRELIKTRLAERGISPERVRFFEATNPPKPGDPVKVGQDWDMTVRIDDLDVPTRVSQPIAHEAYYEVATGNKPPAASDPVARAEYRTAANHYAEQQSLAVTDYRFREAYGGNPTEGGDMFSAPKDARLRDPVQMTQVIEFKSAEARNMAAELRAQGQLGSAVGRDMEEIRQSTKQFNKQVQPRVEGMGGEVPEFIKQGQEMMKKMDSGELTPAQVREQLKAMGETPETFIRKSAQLVEAAQVLQNPNQRGEPARDVFTENVLNRLENRRLMKILEKVDNGELTPEQAREQVQQLEAKKAKAAEPELATKPAEQAGRESTAKVAGPAAEPTALDVAKDKSGRALMGLWVSSTGLESAAEEGRRAAQAGEDPDRLRAGGKAMLEATMLPGIVRSYQHGTEISKEEMDKARKEGRSQTDALLSGFGRVGQDVTMWSLGSRIADEEIAAEEARAAREGREPNYMTSWADATLGGLGEVLMINSIARSYTSLTEQEVEKLGQDKVFMAWAQGKLLEDMKAMKGITRDLQAFVMNADLKDPAFRDKFQALVDRYNKARLAMAKLTDATTKQFGEKDPLALALRGKTGRLPDPPSAEDVIKAREAMMIPVPLVVGSDPQSASRTILFAGLVPQGADVAKLPENRKPGIVFGQTPEPSKRVDPDTPVTFIFHSGKIVEMIKVPDLATLTRTQAEAKVTELKLKPAAKGSEERPPRTAQKHEVFRQKLKPGTEVKEGETVEFEFYAGIKVDHYEGKKRAEAEAAIRHDGLTPQLKEGDQMAKTAADSYKVYEQDPAPGAFLWLDDLVRGKYYKAAEGFLDHDGERVDPRFAEAKVSNGEMQTPRGVWPSAGERTQLMFTQTSMQGLHIKSLTLMIRKFTDEAGARELLKNLKTDPFFTVQSMSAPGVRIVATRKLTADSAIGTLDSATPTVSSASHTAMIVHRGVFVIQFNHAEPVSGYNFNEESPRIVEACKDLIDARFPIDR